jgi:catechol 2,3-dioxygenase-like lactoylglutathione lyase family enzyme
MQLNQVTISVSNLRTSINFYQTLGLKLIVEDDHYARFVVPGNQASFSITVVPNPGVSETTIYFEHEKLDELVKDLMQKGLTFTHGPVDQAWLWREALLEDPDGHKLCLYYAGENRLNPPWKIRE